MSWRRSAVSMSRVAGSVLVRYQGAAAGRCAVSVVSVYGKTRQEAKGNLRELLDKAERNVPVTPARLTVAQYLAEWLIHIRQHVRPNTYVAYEINVRLHIVPRIGKRSLGKLTGTGCADHG
jgi:integrase-like protein